MSEIYLQRMYRTDFGWQPPVKASPVCNKAAVEPVTSQSVHLSVPSSWVKRAFISVMMDPRDWIHMKLSGSCLVTQFSSPESDEVVLEHWSRVSFAIFPLWRVAAKLIVNQCRRITWCERCLHGLFMCCLSLYQAAVVVLKDWSEPCGVMINPKQHSPVVVLRPRC